MSVHTTRLIASDLISSELLDWSQPRCRRTESLHNRVRRGPWLPPITAHSVQMRCDEMSGKNAPSVSK